MSFLFPLFKVLPIIKPITTPIRKKIPTKKIDLTNIESPRLIKSLSNSDLQPKIGLLKSTPGSGSAQRTVVDKKYNGKNDKIIPIIPPFNQYGQFFHPIIVSLIF